MKKNLKIFSLVFFIIIAVYSTIVLTDRKTYSNWQIKNSDQKISWAKFRWVNENLDGKYYEKTAMFIPCKVKGIPNVVTCQFDLGAGLSGVHENSLVSFYASSPMLERKIQRLKSRFQFWNRSKYFKDLSISFGNYVASNPIACVYSNYGEQFEVRNQTDTIHLGTIGADLFKDKVLIIDYPNQQFAICTNVPEDYQANFVDIELDRAGRVILPMRIHGKNYRIMFDNGSSLFPIITLAKNISNFSAAADIDTIQINSWGQQHPVTGKLITDSFELAGQKFCNVKVYSNHSGLGIDHETDGMAGNALFWDKTIIIDFKNKKFGVR